MTPHSNDTIVAACGNKVFTSCEGSEDLRKRRATELLRWPYLLLGEFALDSLGSFQAFLCGCLILSAARLAGQLSPVKTSVCVWLWGQLGALLHCCTVGTAKIDPLQTLGIVPAKALPYWGWGGLRAGCRTGPGLWSRVRQG